MEDVRAEQILVEAVDLVEEVAKVSSRLKHEVQILLKLVVVRITARTEIGKEIRPDSP